MLIALERTSLVAAQGRNLVVPGRADKGGRVTIARELAGTLIIDVAINGTALETAAGTTRPARRLRLRAERDRR